MPHPWFICMKREPYVYEDRPIYMKRDLEKRPMKKRHNASRMIFDPYVWKEIYRFTKRDMYIWTET